MLSWINHIRLRNKYKRFINSNKEFFWLHFWSDSYCWNVLKHFEFFVKHNFTSHYVHFDFTRILLTAFRFGKFKPKIAAISTNWPIRFRPSWSFLNLLSDMCEWMILRVTRSSLSFNVTVTRRWKLSKR